MKLRSVTLVALWCSSTAVVHADEPLHDSPAIKKGQAWMKAMLAPGGAVAAPSKDAPLDYVVINNLKACKAMQAGTAKDGKVAITLKTCLVATYKSIGKASVLGQWTELRDDDLVQFASEFPAKYGKQIKAGAKGATIVSGHYPGDGLNMDVYLAIADGHVRAIWVREEEFE